jgi:hypothetical protein
MVDEYGDIPGQGGNQYAAIDTVIDDADPHVRGTMTRGTSLTFWMVQPRPPSVSFEDWERHTQALWDRAFGVKP